MSSNAETRAQIQAQQDAANKAAYDAQQKVLAQAEASRLNQYYVTNPNNLPSTPHNIDLSSPAGRVLYEEYKKSGVVFDPKTNNIIYNPADLGAYQIEQVKSAHGLTPSFKDSGVPSTQYQSSLFAAGVSAQQVQDIMKERANLVSITNTNKAELAKVAQEKEQNLARQKDIDTEINQLNSTIPSTKIIGYKRGFALYNYSEQDGIRRSISPKIDALNSEKMSLDKKNQELASRQDMLGSNLVNIGIAQKNLFNAENRANYDRLFKPEPAKEQAPIGATAGVKSIVSPIQYTRLQGSTITAREYKSMKDKPATPENLNPSRAMLGGASSQSELFKQVTGAKNAEEAYNIQKQGRSKNLGTAQTYYSSSYGSRDPFGVGGFEGINKDKVAQAKAQGGLGNTKAPSRGLGYAGLALNPQGKAAPAINEQLQYQQSITKNLTPQPMPSHDIVGVSVGPQRTPRTGKLSGPQGNAGSTISKQMSYQQSIQNNLTPKVTPSQSAITGSQTQPRLKGDLVSPINSALQAGAKQVTITSPSGKKQTMSIEDAVKYSQTASEPGSYSFSWLGASKPDKAVQRQVNTDYNKQIQGVISDAKAKGATEITVTDESGKEQTFPVNRAFYDIKKLGNQNLSFAYSKIPQIPEGYTLAGSLSNQILIPERKTMTGPAVPPTLAAQKHSERLLGVDLSKLQPISNFIDTTFETSRPIEQRSKVNQALAGAAVLPYGIGATVYDTAKAVKREIKQPGSGFEYRGTDIAQGGNPLNLPYVKEETPVSDTAFGRALQGKSSNLENPYYQGTILTDITATALGFKGVKTVGRLSEKISQVRTQREISSQVSKLETPKVIIEKQNISSESTIGDFGNVEIAKSKLQNPILKPELQKAKVRVSPVKGTDLFSIESTNPAADKYIFAQKAGKNNYKIYSVEKASQISAPKNIGIRGILGTEEETKFALKPTSNKRYISSSPPSPALEKALGTTSVQPIARIKTFSLSDLIKNPKESGRYLFGETTPLGRPPVNPAQDLLVADTRNFATVGSKVLGQTPSKDVGIETSKTAIFGKKNRLLTPKGKYAQVQIKEKQPTRASNRIEKRVKQLLSSKPQTFSAYEETNIPGIKGTSKRVSDTYASDLLRVSPDNPFTDLTKYQKKSGSLSKLISKYNKQPSKETKGSAGGFGRAKTLQLDKKGAEQLLKEETPKSKPGSVTGFENTFSSLGIYQHEEPARYPPGTKLNRPSFTRSVISGGASVGLSRQQVANSNSELDPFGLITKTPMSEKEKEDNGINAIINPKKRSDYPKSTIIDISTTLSGFGSLIKSPVRTRSKERTITSNIQGIIPRLDVGQGQGLKQKEKTQQQEKIIYDEIFNPPPETRKDFGWEVPKSRGFVPPYYGGGGGGSGRGLKGFAQKKFVVSDISRVIPRGVYYGKQYVSSNPNVFKKFDKLEKKYLKKVGYYGGQKRLPRGFDFF